MKEEYLGNELNDRQEAEEENGAELLERVLSRENLVPRYFNTLNQELLLNMVRERVRGKRVIELIKRYLKSSVMEGGLLVKSRVASVVAGFGIHTHTIAKKGSYLFRII